MARDDALVSPRDSHARQPFRDRVDEQEEVAPGVPSTPNAAAARFDGGKGDDYGRRSPLAVAGSDTSVPGAEVAFVRGKVPGRVIGPVLETVMETVPGAANDTSSDAAATALDETGAARGAFGTGVAPPLSTEQETSGRGGGKGDHAEEAAVAAAAAATAATIIRPVPSVSVGVNTSFEEGVGWTTGQRVR